MGKMDRLTYIGHATTLLRLEGVAILTDPMLRGWLGPLRRQGPRPNRELPQTVDLVLISHLHRDHLDVRSLRRIPPTTPVVAPRGASRWVSKGGAEKILELGVGETVVVEGLELTAIRAVHDGYRDRERGTPIEPLGYLIRRAGRTVYFAGDTGLFPEMSELGMVDLALLPVWGWGPSVGEGHLDPEEAARAVELIRPRLVVPIHWGTFYPAGLRLLRPGPLREPPRDFARLASRAAPDVEVRVVEPGGETALEPR
ncbi:MAG TPA: MBL fold metallo-hydrolase [Solirubrobacterales bacterium]|nr:MBL fold metallo-hydrolase [Solirubrobacterales bacterium]